MSRSGALSLALGLGAALSCGIALATPPGENGDIAFRRYLGPDRTQGTIYLTAPDGTNQRRLTTAPKGGGDDYPDVAADGSFVAFQRCAATCHVFTVKPDGSHLERVDAACGHAPPRCPDDSYPAVSPDLRHIAFVRAFGKIKHDAIAHVGIYVMNRDGTHRTKVTLPPSRRVEDGDPQWSPDGERLVFVRHVYEPKERQAVFVVNADGTHVRRVTTWKLRAGDGPDWSPDGSRLLFRAPESEDFLGSNIYTIRPNGTSLEQVTHASPKTRVYSASFSPDGESITFGMQGVKEQADVWRMRLDGTGLTPVTRTARWDSAPDWGGTATR
jgi:TolB protein